jgi:hypothetical protein
MNRQYRILQGEREPGTDGTKRVPWSPKETVNRVLLVLAGVALGLLAAELTVRCFYPQVLYAFEQGLFMSSADYGYCLTPNVVKRHAQPEYAYTIRSNSLGFRGREPDFSAQTRILVLGDSYGMGQGVGEGKNLCELSQSYFDGQKKNIDIFNTALPGYAGVNQVGVLRKYAADYRPHLVVLLLCWNDIGVTRSLAVQDGYLVIDDDHGRISWFRHWINTHSHLYCLVKNVFYSCRGETPGARDASPRADGAESLAREAHDEDPYDVDIQVAVDHIGEMKRICDRHGATLAVVMLPIFDENQAEARGRLRLLDRLTKEGIGNRDWSELLTDAERSQFFYRYDGHFTEKGHAHFSRYLIRLIEERAAARL